MELEEEDVGRVGQDLDAVPDPFSSDQVFNIVPKKLKSLDLRSSGSGSTCFKPVVRPERMTQKA